MHIIKFTQEQIASMKNMEDFYIATHALDYIKDPKNNIKSGDQILMNHKECDGLLETIVKNLTKRGDKKNPTRMRYIRNSAGMDWVDYAPVSCDDVPSGELWLCAKEESDALLEKIRAAAKTKEEKGE